MADPSLVGLRAFVAVARHRSFRGAADALGVSRSSLSHAVAALEAELEVKLLHRTTRNVATTAAGADLLVRLTPTIEALDGAVDAVRNRGAEPAGTVRVNASEEAARWLLAHAVPDLLARHPRVALDLVTDGRLVDVVAEGFDAGVRLCEAMPKDMVAVPSGGPVRFLAVASPSYLAGIARPETPDDLHRHRCIRQRLPSGRPYHWEFARGRREVTVDVPGALTLDSNRLMVDAAAAGLGVAFVPEPEAATALAAGSPVALLEPWSPPLPGLCLYYPGHRRVPPPLRALVDAVRTADRANRPL